QVGVGQVHDVDVVPDAGAVGRRVVVAVHDRGLAPRQGSEHLGEQVWRAGVGELGGPRAADVEVAQRGLAQPGVDAGEVAQEPLAADLGLAVGALGGGGGVL